MPKNAQMIIHSGPSEGSKIRILEGHTLGNVEWISVFLKVKHTAFERHRITKLQRLLSDEQLHLDARVGTLNLFHGTLQPQ
ncbi:hypothetical protein NC651_016814 [Populus alba x Populus x berolinensis]|nr:hypothetical protein NC651_016814 [Populus alba x Populus x berolinensis]